MDPIFKLLIVLAVGLVLWGVAAAVLVIADRRRRGLPVNVLLLKLYFIPYLHQYRQLTRAETGRTGPLFWHYTVPLTLAMALAMLSPSL